MDSKMGNFAQTRVSGFEDAKPRFWVQVYVVTVKSIKKSLDFLLPKILLNSYYAFSRSQVE